MQRKTLLTAILLVLLAIAVVPMINAFTPAMRATTALDEEVLAANHARGTLNRLLAQPYDRLAAAQTNEVDLNALLGSAELAAQEYLQLDEGTLPPRVAIRDASGGTGGLLEVSVSLKGITLRSLKADR